MIIIIIGLHILVWAANDVDVVAGGGLKGNYLYTYTLTGIDIFQYVGHDEDEMEDVLILILLARKNYDAFQYRT